MRDIAHKIHTLRTASASAELHMKQESVEAVRDNHGPKKDVPATARAAGYLAVKNTHNAIPHCHPIPVESVNIEIEYLQKVIKITVDVKTVYKTGCEMEALHGASVAALTIYDMLKPVDKDIEIKNIRLVEKKGGKSDFNKQPIAALSAAIIVCSDSIAKGTKEDKAGKVIEQKLRSYGIGTVDYQVIPDESTRILNAVTMLYNHKTDLIITTGGTGLGPRDVTSETLKPFIEKEIPGVMEAARHYGQLRTPYSMLSRSVAGLKGRSLILCLPGSTKGAEESMDALFPAILHIFKVLEKGYRHEEMEEK